ncbi:MAG TPA: tetratricopeptide repeat protein [Candidatus Lustribacter sp.]|nr:tetratricopeptide repeat protein [Candidatus Lustribacter sp.]
MRRTLRSGRDRRPASRRTLTQRASPPPASLAIRVVCAGNVTEESLAGIDAALNANPGAVDLRFARACLLEELGRRARARAAYQNVLAAEPTHFGALMNLGTMFYLDNRRPEARNLYEYATHHHPAEANAFVNLGNVLAPDDPRAARRAYERALELEPSNATANFGLALLLEALGDAEAETYRRRAFAAPIVRTTPYRGSGEPVRLLVLLSALGGNLITSQLLDDRRVEATSLLVESWRDGAPLPPHDAIFNAIGDAERAGDALAPAERIAAASARPLLNRPEAVRRTRRDAIARLNAIPGVIAPQTELLARAGITADALAARGFRFPLLLRTPGYHSGEHFARVASPGDLPHALATLPGDDLLVIAFLDARGAGGNVRKYRALFVDGGVYPVHLAIAPGWKVHYFSANMRDDDANRAEEAAFLSDMTAHLGLGAMTALSAIARSLELDYAGVDFGLGSDGSVLVFEANATMAIYWPDDDERFAYRRAAIARIVDAAQRMVSERAAAPRS